ncbi:hypothetical protein Tco_0619261 [Tanacetum coccineum]
MGDDVDISTLTIVQYLALIQDNNRPGIVKPKIGDDIEFEINRIFMRELRRKLFAGPFHDKEEIIREEEQDYDIPLHDDVMQPLTHQTVHITPPDDDYVAPATSPTLDKQLNEFGK